MIEIICMEYPGCRNTIPLEIGSSDFLVSIGEDDRIEDFCGMLGLILSSSGEEEHEVIFMPCRGSKQNH